MPSYKLFGAYPKSCIEPTYFPSLLRCYAGGADFIPFQATMLCRRGGFHVVVLPAKLAIIWLDG